MRLQGAQIKKNGQNAGSLQKVIFNPVNVSELCYYTALTLRGEKGKTERLHPFGFPKKPEPR